MKFKPRPALYFLIPYLLGIIAGKWVSLPVLWLWLTVLLCLVGGIATRHRRRYLCYGLLHLAVFTGGMLRLETASHSPIPPHFYNQPVSFSGTTTYQPERGEAWDACYATGELQLLSDPMQAVSAKFLIRFQKLVPLRYGRQITLTGVLQQPQDRRNPGGFDYRAYLARQGIVGIIDAKGLLRIGEQGGFLPLSWIEALRIRTERVIDHIYTPFGTVEPSLHAQLLKGILLGKRSDLPTETLDIFRNSGTFHVLAVSGLHVGLVAMFCYFGFSCFRLPQKVLCLLTIAAVLMYACLIGFRPSVFRASLMAILFLFATLIDRDADLFNLLAFAALVLLLLNPLQIWDVGFQLSFVAVAAIVYFVPKMEQPLRRLWENEADSSSQGGVPVLTRFKNKSVKWLVLSYLVTLAAQIGTTPLIAYHFFRTYPLGLIVGPFAVGLVSLIVAVGMASVCVGFIYLPFASLLTVFNRAIISVFLGLIGIFGQTWGIVKLTPPTFSVFVLYIAFFLGIVQWRSVYKYWRIASLIGLSVLAIYVWDTAFHERGKLLEVVTLDVGQGDAAFVRFPDNRTMLIDGGIQRTYYDEKKQRFVDYDVGKRVIEPYLDFRRIRRLDMVVLTHPDVDHGGGLGHILENFEVGRVIGISDIPLNSETHRRLHAIVNANNIPYAFPYAGKIELTPTATLNLLHPIDAASTNLLDQDKNDDSLVMKLTYGEVDILFTGDIGKKAEARLIASGQDLRSEVLKVPHHGSSTSSSARFIDAVEPRYAIFSLGQSSQYQFPHADVVARYRARGCVQVRTDESGAITLRTDGKRCWIEGVE
ncbi:MAG: DNA internalization-related competence protein ComEC/Rec2 [Candidatus Poribacteria bacterium]|nr:DNA internalization-related competence protein ComEC/Rec2 [Candidatus Poribacteria bacterium]